MNFGNEVHLCAVSGEATASPDLVATGATLPGVKAGYWIKNTPQVWQTLRQQKVAFHESEGNCNTCKNLERVPHPRNSAGFLYGSCAEPASNTLHYKAKFGSFGFHPDDPMQQPCYESRFK